MRGESRVLFPCIFLPLRPCVHFPQCGHGHFRKLGWRAGKLPANLAARRLSLVAFAQPRVAKLFGPSLLVLQVLDLLAASCAMLAMKIIQCRSVIFQDRLPALLLCSLSGALGFQMDDPLLEEPQAASLLVVIQPRA